MSYVTKFNMTRDVGGQNGFGLVPSNVIYSTELASGVAQEFTVPTDTTNYIVIFSYSPGANVFVDCSDTATAPGGSFAEGTIELNPSARAVASGTTISCITPDTNGAYITAAIYIVQPYTN